MLQVPPEPPVRRGFLRLTIALAAAVPAVIGGLVTAFLSNSFRAPARPGEIWLCNLKDLPEAGYVRCVVRSVSHLGWEEREEQTVVYVGRGEDGSPIVLSAACSHLGCGVHWDPDGQVFRCPCHAGMFDALGNVLSGPPATGLVRLPTRVEGAGVWVRPGGLA